MKPTFTPGNNMAMKVPTHEFESTVSFYRDILSLQQIDNPQQEDIESVCFRFGDKTLWIDRVAEISQAEIWLEIITDDIEIASRYLGENNCIRRDEIEPLPANMKGFWLANPANIIHLITE